MRCLRDEKLPVPKAFVVTNKKDNPASLHDIPVVQLDEIQDKGAKILVALGQNARNSVIDDLKGRGFYDIV